MPNYQKHIVYLSDEQRQELFTNGSITVNGQTVTYSDNDMYVTPQEAPVTDVQVNGTSVTANGVADIPIASTSAAGVVMLATNNSLLNDTNGLRINPPSDAVYKNGDNNGRAVTAAGQHKSAFYGLAKAAGSDEKDSTLPVGQYTDNAKTAIREMLDTAASDIVAVQDTQPTSETNKVWLDELHKSSVQVPTVAEMNTALEGKVGDVQINGSSIVQNGVANLPIGRENVFGVCKVKEEYGTSVYQDTLAIKTATDNQIKSGVSGYNARPITPANQNKSVFYGLAKAAGADMKDIASTTVGVYPDAQKAAIQNMLGVSPMIAPVESDATADRAYAIGEIFSYNGKLYQATDAIAQDGTINPSINCQEVTLVGALPHDVQVNGVSVVSNGVANVPLATNTSVGLVSGANGSYGITIGTNGNFKGQLLTNEAVQNDAKVGLNHYKPIVPAIQHAAAFYGLAKAAGDTTQSQSDNAVGTYTDEAKTAIRSMIGAAGTENYATEQTAGVVKVNGAYGTTMTSNNQVISLVSASVAQLKAGTPTPCPITPTNFDSAIFYGLAKASGDVTMHSSSNAVGTYTDNAKASIKSMLGVVDGSTGTADITGTTPTITAVENTRYVCGEVSTLTFTPPSSGITIVRFTSGTTPAVLTVPNTVVFPEWFDASTLEASRVYEICITDGVYGAVMSWPL